MATTQDRADEAYQKALLAAVVAVKRGFLTADAAMEVLSNGDPPAAPVPADPVQSVLNVNPDAPRAALTNELNDLLKDSEWMKSAWQRIELSAEQAASLSSMRPGAGQLEEARAVLTALARERLQALRERLPLSNETRYSVVREFARGGMGRILIATDNAVGREVALKEVLVPDAAQGRDPTDADPEAVERFLREAKVTGQLDHPGIVPVYEISRRQDGSIFYTMKLVRGVSMTARMEEIASSSKTDAQKFAERMKLLEAFLDVCHAIAYAHARGVIHRDLKPDNIMLGDYGETVVLDWGLARVRGTEDVVMHRDTPRFSQSLMKNAQESHTLAGSVMGTPGYMAPEQAAGQLHLVDERSDVYALGAILYQILAGHQPYIGGGAMTVVEQVLAGDPTPLKVAAPLAPPDLVTLAEKAMARDREKRVGSAAQLADEIAAYRGGRTLSVYNYSSAELLKRFVARNRAAVGVGAMAGCVLIVVLVLSVLNIRSERDVAEGALAERDALAAEQRAKSEQLIAARRERIAAQKIVLAGLNPDEARKQARELEAARKALTVEQRRVQGVNQPEVSAAATRLLNAAAAREELIRLALEPVAGKREALIAPDELRRHEEALVSDRVLAASLSTLNEDFAVAGLILDGTNARGELMDRARSELSSARTELLRRRAERIGTILQYIRAGEDDNGRSVNAARVQDFVVEVGGWREQQTVDLLVDALNPRIASAREQPEGTVWNIRQRFEIQFICEVLLQSGRAEHAVPPLAELMLALSDEELVVQIAITLSRLEHPSAWQPLAELKWKAGDESPLWSRVKRQFWRVPEPTDLPRAVSVEEQLNLARLRLDQGRLEPATEVLEAILARNPTHQEALLTLSRAQDQSRQSGRYERALELVERVIAENPYHARALAWKARILLFGLPGQLRPASMEEKEARRDQINEFAERAVAAAPRDWWPRLIRATTRRYLDEKGEWAHDPVLALQDLDLAIELAPRSPELYVERARTRLSAVSRQAAPGERAGAAKNAAPLSLVDLNRAIDLDPENSNIWAARADIYGVLENFDASIRDISRAIELDPARFQHYRARGHMRHEIKDYAGALDDFKTIIEMRGESFPPVFAERANVYESMGELELAIEGLQRYVDLRPGFFDNDRVLQEIEELKRRLKDSRETD